MSKHQHQLSTSTSTSTSTLYLCLIDLKSSAIHARLRQPSAPRHRGNGFSRFLSLRVECTQKTEDMHPPLRTVPRVPAYRALPRPCVWVPTEETR
jgi:hypothetical protein